MRIPPLATCIASALMAVAAVAGCSSNEQPATARSALTQTASPSTAPHWQCPQTSQGGWPETNHPGAQDTLVPATPTNGYRCVYTGPASHPTLDGSTTQLTLAELKAIAARFNTAPAMWSHSCPGPTAQDPRITFEKYYFEYPDQTAVSIELGRYNCPPSITNGKTTRAISPRPTESLAPTTP